MRARYCTRNWGGTDHEELRDPRQRRGSGSSILRQDPKPLAPFSVLPDRPTGFLPRHSTQNLPREAFPNSMGVDRVFLALGRWLLVRQSDWAKKLRAKSE